MPLPTPTVNFGAAQDHQASPSLDWASLSPDQLSPESPLPAAQPLAPASAPTRPGRLLRSFEVGDRDIASLLLTLNLLPTNSGPEVPQPPRSLLEALEQRMERYHVAAAQAKAKGDQRKARMHERIVKVCRGPDECSPDLSWPPNTSVPCSNTKMPFEPTRQAELWMWLSCQCPQVGYTSR